ncbi:hypothetical protein RJ640_022674 [Escallonia rubra]|uniref:Uncharacterized protein n=1 Tax=Escallonia rubra TaxID=112253 RepID=A0AA88QTB7_9ASTE|nr:hypothetical protein RJ640_022674 [Escallonia rubra]
MRTTKIKEISENLGKLEIELEYLVEAWLQIVECRQAEAALEKLHECAEGEVQANLMEKISATDIVGYADFQRKLVHLTSVTRNHFEKLVTALQNDLSDVQAQKVKEEEGSGSYQSSGLSHIIRGFELSLGV